MIERNFLFNDSDLDYFPIDEEDEKSYCTNYFNYEESLNDSKIKVNKKFSISLIFF